MEYDFELLKKQYEKLPSDIRIAISSTDVAQKITDIAENHKLMLDKVDELSKEVSFVMLGLTHPSDLIKNLRRRLDISTDTALAIAQDINDEVFLPIRESLRNIHQEKVVFDEDEFLQAHSEDKRELTPQQKKYAPFARPRTRPTTPEQPKAPPIKMEQKIVVSDEETRALQGDLPEKPQKPAPEPEQIVPQSLIPNKPEPVSKPVPPPEPPKPEIRYAPAREVVQPSKKTQQQQESQPTQRRYIDPYLMNRARILYEIENPTEIKHTEPDAKPNSAPIPTPQPQVSTTPPSQKYDVRPHSPERLKSEALLRSQRSQSAPHATQPSQQIQQKTPINNVIPSNSTPTPKPSEQAPVTETKPKEKIVLNDLSSHKSPYKPHFDPPNQKTTPKEPVIHVSQANTPINSVPTKKTITPEVKVEDTPKVEPKESTPHPELLPEIPPEQHLAIKKGEELHEIPSQHKPKQIESKEPVHDIIEKYPKHIVEKRQSTEEKLAQQPEVKPVLEKVSQEQEIVQRPSAEIKPITSVSPQPSKNIQAPKKKLFSIMDHLMSAPKSSKGEKKQDPYREPI